MTAMFYLKNIGDDITPMIEASKQLDILLATTLSPQQLIKHQCQTIENQQKFINEQHEMMIHLHK